MKLRWEYNNLDELGDFRIECKIMAQKLRNKRPLRHGRYPIRRITNKVIEGDVMAHELFSWYPIAQTLVNPYGQN